MHNFLFWAVFFSENFENPLKFTAYNHKIHFQAE